MTMCVFFLNQELRRQLSYLRKDERSVNMVFICGGKSSGSSQAARFTRVGVHREILAGHSKLLQTLIEISDTKDPSGTVSITLDPEVNC